MQTLKLHCKGLYNVKVYITVNANDMAKLNNRRTKQFIYVNVCPYTHIIEPDLKIFTCI